jgi:hypothetical protein
VDSWLGYGPATNAIATAAFACTSHCRIATDCCSSNTRFRTATHIAPRAKNVTADPPRTEIWAPLYAQVKQVDNKEFRNILLDDLVLSPYVQVEHDKAVLWKRKYTAEERNTLKRAALGTFRDDANYASAQNMFKLADPIDGQH